ncbi:MAG: diacylglycerol kinase family protein [Candidatus Dojkabacteria bacterium]|jgi:diacylglycerol kinase|nr:diacylglycerol kinase family protein [Candidatus Dojkabacteria bacterium]
MKNESFKTEDFFKSQGYARNGIKLIFKNERNFRIELVITALVILAGVFFKISHFEWIAISLVISMVLISETINSAIEALCDTVSQDFKINVKYAKDVSAGAVLVSALVSVITGLIIFLPYIILFLQKIITG